MAINDSRTEFANALKRLIRLKTLEDISVGEIAAESGLSRQLFYKYFTDKYDLAFWCYIQSISPVLQDYEDGRITFHDQNLMMLRIFKNEPDFYRNIFQNFEVQNSFFQQYHCFSMSNWKSIAGIKYANDPQLLSLYRLYVYGCNHMVMNYVLGGMKEQTEFIADIFDDALPEKLRHLFKVKQTEKKNEK